MLVINQFVYSSTGTTAWCHYLLIILELMFECHQPVAFLLSICANFASREINAGNNTIGTIATIERLGISPARDLEDAIYALPVKAKAELLFASTVELMRHSCGHDDHTTMLRCAVLYLTNTFNFKVL